MTLPQCNKSPVHEISSLYKFCYLIIRNVHWLVWYSRV